ncbi:MAG: alpha/beta fold hydrolase, partial [Micromonosporaceae bacterium]
MTRSAAVLTISDPSLAGGKAAGRAPVGPYSHRYGNREEGKVHVATSPPRRKRPGYHTSRPAGPGEVLEAHRQAGRPFRAGGVGSFVREQGSGPVVLCIHGMIDTSFLYRKVLAELAARGLRGVAFDLPGFGLAERPPGYDYSWTSLGRFCAAAVDELGLG